MIQLPIKTVMVDSVNIPELNKNQHKTEDELMKKETSYLCAGE